MPITDSLEIVLTLEDLLHDIEQFCIDNLHYTPNLNDAMEIIISEGVGDADKYKELRLNISSLVETIIPNNTSRFHSGEIKYVYDQFTHILDTIMEMIIINYPRFNNFERKGYIVNSVILLPHGSVVDQFTGNHRNTHILSISIFKMPF